MGKRADARLAKVLDAVLEKASLRGSPPMAMASQNITATPSGGAAQILSMSQPGAPLAAALGREQFSGSALSAGSPFWPAPLDPVDPKTGRPAPRKFSYDVADNLNITKKLPQWNVLAAAAVQCDLFARAITIRTSDVTKMDWSFNPSPDLVNTIMEDNRCTISEAARIARNKTMADIVRLQEFWENPYPQHDRGWSEWVTEGLWQVLVYDGWGVHPEFTLGGKLIGLNTIDASTIKILLDNYGDFPRPPDPAYQQILFGFPRGEFIASPNSDVTDFLDGAYNISDRDQLSYFVMNRRTNTPYGFSPVEQSLPIANIYLERENWLLAEYKFGTAASVYMRTNSQEIDLNNLSSANRVLNDLMQGQTANRQSTVYLPEGFDPTFAPTIGEKYKGDYDELLIKRVAAFFGVAPAQFGIVARAGLGGGKGAGEAEHDNVETVSSKPMNNYLEDCVNSLCRRYLGATRAVTFTLKDDEGTQDEVMVSTANKNYISFAAKTSNEIRGELGLPLSDQPEADELMLATPNGPVYLRGTLETQMNPPPPPPSPFGGPSDPVHNSGNPGAKPQTGAQGQEKGKEKGGVGQAQGGPGGSQGGGQGGKTTPALKAAEAKAFKVFAATSGPNRREFAFKYLSADEQDELKAGLAPDGPKSRVFAY